MISFFGVFVIRFRLSLSSQCESRRLSIAASKACGRASRVRPLGDAGIAHLFQMAVSLGLDRVVIDAEHGISIGKKSLSTFAHAVRATPWPGFVRIAEVNVGLVKGTRLGAAAWLFPGSNPPSSFAQAVAFALYPRGVRGMGAERATDRGQALPRTCRRGERPCFRRADPRDREGTVDNLPEMLAVPGSSSSGSGRPTFVHRGYRGQWEGPGVAEAILRHEGCGPRPPANTAASWRSATTT